MDKVGSALRTKLPATLRYGKNYIQFKRLKLQSPGSTRRQGPACLVFAVVAQIIIEAGIESISDIEKTVAFLYRPRRGTATLDEGVSLPPLERRSSLTVQIALLNQTHQPTDPISHHRAPCLSWANHHMNRPPWKNAEYSKHDQCSRR